MELKERIKNRIKWLEEQIDAFSHTKWAKRLRITSGVSWNLLLLFIVFGLTLTVFAASVGAGYFASLVAKEPLRSKEEMRHNILTYEETSEIYLADNVYLGKVNADIERKETKLENVSQYVIDAVLATEDEYFETHPGVVPKAIFRGVFQDVTNSHSQTGGSTLTQQLIKLQILTNEVSYDRKAKEILLAMRLEHFMDKEEILEAYLNIIPYGRNVIGQNIAGIETAAEGIFNVTAKDLTLPQAAYIAGIPQAPYAYTPFYSGNQGLKEPEALQPGINRMKTVLFRMKETGYITEEQYNEAIAYDITKDFRDPMLRANERYPYLTQEIQNRTVDILAKILAEEDAVDPDRLDVESKLKEKYKILARRAMTTGGYRIYSTIDKKLYDKMNEVAKNFEHYGHTFTTERTDPETGEKILVKDPVQVGSIMIENSSGKILSFIGGRDYADEALNHATQAFRQNGSSMKPLVVYAPAIEYGVIGAGSPVVDVKFNTSWRLNNYNASQELGIIPARQALATSQNLSTARLYRDIIDRQPVEFLEKMGFSRLHEHDYTNPSLSIGAMMYGTSVEENTNAFGTFANGGKFIDAYMIEKIEDREGNIVFQHEIEPVDVFSPQTSYIISDMLRDVTKYGTATTMKRNLNFNVDIAAKTGTTDNYRDVWLVGYNPNISLGVWLGHKDTSRGLYDIRNSYLHPSMRVNLLFARLMNAANEVQPALIGAGDTFKRPEGVVTRSFCGISGLAPSAACSAAGLVRSDLFNAKVFVPNKADDSLTSGGAYVSVQGRKYLALPSTPSEFIQKGSSGVNEAFVKRMLGPWGGDPSKLFPGSSNYASNMVSGAVFHPDNAAPSGVQASLNGSTLTWSASPSNDVIGYYVYQGDGNNSKRVGVIHDQQSRAISVGGGTYFVRAVDITGKQSVASNVITVGGQQEEQDPSSPDDSSSSEGDGQDGNQDKDKEQEKDPSPPQQGNDGKEEGDKDESPPPSSDNDGE